MLSDEITSLWHFWNGRCWSVSWRRILCVMHELSNGVHSSGSNLQSIFAKVNFSKAFRSIDNSLPPTLVYIRLLSCSCDKHLAR